VPKSAVADIFHNAAFKAVGAVCADVTKIGAKAIQDRFAGFGKALNRIHYRYLFFDAEVVNQGSISFFMDSGLEAAEVDGDSVWNLVIQGFYNTLS
jgi:hypothetical protein